MASRRKSPSTVVSAHEKPARLAKDRVAKKTPEQVSEARRNAVNVRWDKARKRGCKDPVAVAVGESLDHSEGGNARAEKLKPGQRTEIARLAAEARWGRPQPSMKGMFSIKVKLKKRKKRKKPTGLL
jgi:hypothetical protein